MSAAITISFANPAPGVCPTNFEESVALLRTLISGSIPDPFTPYVVQAATPAVNQQNYIWYKLDGGGRPVAAMKYYNGNWRRIPNGVLGEVRMFKGDPTGKFDSSGLGVIGGDWDGWALCNGDNGTTNLTDRFIISAHMDGSAGLDPYTNGVGWQNKVTGVAAVAGGEDDVTLNAGNTYRPARDEVKVWEWKADGNSGRDGGNMYGGTSTPGISHTLLEADAGNESPTPFQIIPPFYTFALVEFRGYA